MYNKLVTTALMYTPVILEHHIPYKTLANGKLCAYSLVSSFTTLDMQHYSKQPTQTQKFKTLQKLVLSYLNNIIHILLQLTDNEMLRLALSGSAKLIPYIMSSRKAVKQYLKVRRLSRSFYKSRSFSFIFRNVWSCGQLETIAFG